MSPTRRIINRRGYLTEARYENGKLLEMPLCRTTSPCGGEEPQNQVAGERLRRVLDETEARVRAAHATHLDSPRCSPATPTPSTSTLPRRGVHFLSGSRSGSSTTGSCSAAGNSAFMPAGVRHGIWNVGDVPATVLAIFGPAADDGFTVIDRSFKEPWRSVRGSPDPPSIRMTRVASDRA